jgi:hypothetical protein
MTNSFDRKIGKKCVGKKCAADAGSHFDDDERHQTTSGPLLLVSFFSFSQILFSEWSRFYHSRWVLLLRVVPPLRKRRTTVFVCFPNGEAKELWRFGDGADDGDVKDKNAAFEWK